MQATALLLVDCQHDFLQRPGLVPDAGTFTARASTLLQAARALAIPIAHAHTIVRADGDDCMPHWKRRGTRECVAGSRGAESPAPLRPLAGEFVARKQHYSAFADPELERWLREQSISRLVVAGLYLHACVRSTTLDAYSRGYEVWVADNAVGTTEPLHGELTRAWLGERGAWFRSVEDIVRALAGREIEPGANGTELLPAALIAGVPRAGDGLRSFVHRDPSRTTRVFSEVPLAGAAEVAAAAGAAEEAQRAWAGTDPTRRAECLERWARDLDTRRGELTELLIAETGKPRRFAEEEIGRAIVHARLAAELARVATPTTIAPGISAVPRPVGVVGLVTPWNNPIAIPVGKIAPALAFGNAVVLKPAPQATKTALALVDGLARAGIPAGLANVVMGTAEATRAMCLERAIVAVSLTGSLETGRVVAALCAQGLKPLQAELGGNNAAIVLSDADLERLVPDLARAAFGFAGQRCTAIRRFVVERSVAARFETLAAAAIESLALGDPADPATEVGPLISLEKRDGVLAAIARARAEGARLVTGGEVPPAFAHGAWVAPALLADADPRSAVAQQETFGPVAILQVAHDLEDALTLANGVPQGLVMRVHTGDAQARARILEAAEAGIVHLGAGSLGIDPRAPFGGWKASGLGPPEHGVWDVAFYTRPQARYEGAGC